MAKVIAKVWTFKSDSNPNKTYETLQYTDGSTSCGCMGWCRRVAADGTRSCKHTRSVDMGTADDEATAKADYESGKKTKPVKVVAKAKKTVHKGDSPLGGVVRKIQW